MSVEIHGDIPGLDEASQHLDALIAADAADGAGGAGQDPTGSVTQGAGETPDPGEPAEHAAGSQAVESTQDPKTVSAQPPPDPKTSQADPAAGKPGEAAKPGETKPAEAKPGETKPGDNQSRYQKAQGRQEKSWQELNAQKDALKSEREAFAAERQRFDQERTTYQQERDKAEAEFSPEQYEAAAKKFEAEGKYDLADAARDRAKKIRATPPSAQRQQQAAQTEAQTKEWALKAGVDFPELAEANSPLQVRVAQLLKDEPDLKAHPKGIYVAARIADLEGQAAKGRDMGQKVAAREHELGQLRARVKELEALTAPGGEAGAARLPQAKTFEQMSDDEQFAELSREATEVGVLSR